MAVRCPYCGRWFKNKRALKTHIRRAHPTEYIVFEAWPKIPKPPKIDLSLDLTGIFGGEGRKRRKSKRKKRR